MGTYHRLAPDERYQIAALMQSGLSLRAMAGILDRCPSSISRELKRNCVVEKYDARHAQRLARERRKVVGPPKRIDRKIEKKIRALLICQQLSPEQIRAYFEQEKISISAETIYKFVYLDRHSGGKVQAQDVKLKSKRERPKLTLFIFTNSFAHPTNVVI